MHVNGLMLGDKVEGVFLKHCSKQSGLGMRSPFLSMDPNLCHTQLSYTSLYIPF